MKKALLLLSFLSFLTFNLLAQESTVDMVILKDGSVIKGEITTYEAEKSVEIKTQGGSLLEFGMTEVESIKFDVDPDARPEKPPRQKIPKADRAPHINNKQGIYSAVTLGFLPGFGSKYSFPGVGRTLSYTLGYRINSLTHIGIGYGGNFDQLDFDGNNHMIFYAEYRANFLEKSLTPYLVFKAGYGTTDFMPIDGNNYGSGGLMLNPAVGIQLPSKRKFHFDLSIGYLLQGDEFFYYDTFSNEYKSERAYLHLLGLYAGFSF